ncbi:hypothetical protein DAEQUDRAFT_725117 [Daedalea quercina L-15889]|uniref:CENP-V/GFA domain-containing protein n=1 Tax=Daedalea quercina L-15889 TaxID=1314783 RepID=A0A165RCX1_9APHY|nr:hypothetical protein DAEQUDRAFT_725117 [Daedalea quercina L-15889]
MSTLGETTLGGSCHCGALTYTATTSSPTFTGYCHCTKCQRLTGGPLVATIHFPPNSVTFSAVPVAALHTYRPASCPHETRYRCNVCGVGVGSVNAMEGHTAVWGATLTRIAVAGEDSAGKIAMWEKISPVLHFYYGVRVLDVRDGLRKYRESAPEEAGKPGSWNLQGGDMEETDGGEGRSENGGDSDVIHGGCFCGEVRYTFSPSSIKRSAYCHCTQCQKLSGCPFIHTIHLFSSAVSFTLAPSGDSKTEKSTILASDIDANALPSSFRTYNSPVKSHKTRLRCATCGTCVASSNSQTGTTSVWGVHLTRSQSEHISHWDKVKPTAHIFYDTHLLEIKDGLSKWSGYEGSSKRLDL